MNLTMAQIKTVCFRIAQRLKSFAPTPIRSGFLI